MKRLLLPKSEQGGTITSGTAAAIAAIPEADPSKKWFTLRYELLTSGRDYTQLTLAEKSVVESEATQLTKSGAHARAVRAIALDISGSYGSTGIGIHNADLPSGVIFIRLVTDGKLAGVEKMVVIR